MRKSTALSLLNYCLLRINFSRQAIHKIIFACSAFGFTIYSQSSAGSNELDAHLSDSGWAYVIVMLEHSEWPRDLAKQKEFTYDLQMQALDGPLARGFNLVHRFETVPALAGWIDQSGYDRAQHSRSLNDANNIIRRIDLDVSGSANPMLMNSGGGGLADSVAMINADQVHDDGITGAGIEIAVLDTGIDSDHPDLSDSLIAEQCYCFNPSGGCCPNGLNIQSGFGSAEDDHGHGTHVSGILASNGIVSATGVAPDSNITMIKMLDRNNSFYSTSDIVASLDWINTNRPNIDVVSMSLYTNAMFTDSCDNTYSWTQALYHAVQNLVDKGVVVVAIAGNNGIAGEITAPGCLTNVINVGAVDKYDVAASFSNSHFEVDLFAPGVNITSDSIWGGVTSMSGTSMACPHVSGVAALARQVNHDTSRDELLNVFISTGVPITDWNGITRPRIDASAAINLIKYDDDQDKDGIPDLYDPEPTVAADGQCIEHNDGSVSISYNTYTNIELCQATDRIVTGNSVIITETADLTYISGKAIQIFPGFTVLKGGTFHAHIAH